jgi:hypothetical protein
MRPGQTRRNEARPYKERIVCERGGLNWRMELQPTAERSRIVRQGRLDFESGKPAGRMGTGPYAQRLHRRKTVHVRKKDNSPSISLLGLGDNQIVLGVTK